MNILSLQAVLASMHIEPANKDGRSDNTGVHIRGEAGCGGAHSRAWVRVRATAGVWQACGGGSQRLLTCRSYRRGREVRCVVTDLNQCCYKFDNGGTQSDGAGASFFLSLVKKNRRLGCSSGMLLSRLKP